MSQAQHLPEETIAMIIDGVLPEQERAQAMSHLNACPSCYEIFIEASRFIEAEAEAEPTQTNLIRPVRFKRTLYPALLAAAALLVWFLGSQLHFGEDPISAYVTLARQVAQENGYATVRFRLPLPIPEQIIASREVHRGGAEDLRFDGETYDNLRAFLENEVAHEPDRPEPSLRLISCHLLAGHFVEAYSVASQATTRMPQRLDLTCAALLSNYALMRAKGQDLEAGEALAQMKHLATQNPKQPDILYNAAVMARELNDIDAKALANAYLTLNPQGPHADFLAH